MRQQQNNLHECYNVLVNFCGVTVLAFVLKTIGLEHAGHEILAVAIVVNLAVGDDILGKCSDRIGNRTLGLNRLEREGGDPGEKPQNEQAREGRVFTAHLFLSLPDVDEFDGTRGVTDGIEVVTESDTANDVQGGAGGIAEDVELERRLARGVNLVRNAGLEGAGDIVDVGVHCADVVRGKSGGDETTHALMLLLTLDPDERAAGDAGDEGAENRRVMVIVRVLCVDVGEPNVVTYNQLYE